MTAMTPYEADGIYMFDAASAAAQLGDASAIRDHEAKLTKAADKLCKRTAQKLGNPHWQLELRLDHDQVRPAGLLGARLDPTAPEYASGSSPKAIVVRIPLAWISDCDATSTAAQLASCIAAAFARHAEIA